MAIKILPEGTIEGSGGMDIGSPSQIQEMINLSQAVSDDSNNNLSTAGQAMNQTMSQMKGNLSDRELAMLEKNQAVLDEMGMENIPPSENMGMDSMMPQMSEEEKETFRYLTQVEGLAPDVAIDIMASEKVKEMGGRVSPEEFGGLPSANPPAVSGSPNAQQPMTPSGAGMSEQDMMNYIVNQAEAIRARTGGQPMRQPMGALPR